MREETKTTRPPLPPFTHETAVQKVRLAEDAWNSRDPEKVASPTRCTRAGETAASMIFPSGNQTASTIGPLDAVRMTIRD